MTWLRRITLCLSVVMITALTQATDVCDSACHCLEYDADFVVVNCKSSKNQQEIDFDLFEWPKRENRSIKAFFNNISIHLLPKISGDSNVVALNFDDNTIRTLPSNPFEYFSNLESISIANNLITDLNKDFLKSVDSLKTLNLSNNSLSIIDVEIVAHLTQLNEIDLSMNELTKISADLLEALRSVEIFKAAHNKIFTIDNAHNQVDYRFQQLFLAHNQFTVITGAMFEKFTNLQSIDLSHNKIQQIDEHAFNLLNSLKFLDLSYNNIKRIYIKLPNTLEILTMEHNQLIAWPLANTPDDLMELELQSNSLEYIFPKDREVSNLRILDVSNNRIENLPNTQFRSLEKLDLSSNLLTSVPQNLNNISPLLRELILDSNQITSVYFTNRTTLAAISLSNMPNLETIEPRAFSNLAGLKIRPDGTTCIDIHVSHNPNLREIHETAFEGVELCQLDLSFNQLTKLPRNLTVWHSVHEGIDLQGNPLSCYCEDQWMLQEILTKLMINEQYQFLLHNLKCHTPEELNDQRFVRFLYHDDPFCGSNGVRHSEKMVVEKSGFGGFSFASVEDNNIKIELTHGPGFVIIIAMCVIILIAMILVGIKWQRDQNRKLAIRNRLYQYDY